MVTGFYSSHRAHQPHHHAQLQLSGISKLTNTREEQLQSHPVQHYQIWRPEVCECADYDSNSAVVYCSDYVPKPPKKPQEIETRFLFTYILTLYEPFRRHKTKLSQFLFIHMYRFFLAIPCMYSICYKMYFNLFLYYCFHWVFLFP